MELQQRQPDLDRSDTALFAVSYDAVEALAAFAAKHAITFPLLSDDGSHAIRALGLLNEHVVEQHGFYGVKVRDEHFGVPYPGVFLLDEQGIVVAKVFEQSYRVRPAPALLLEDVLGPDAVAPAVTAQVEREGLRVAAWLGSATYRPWQKLRLHLALRVAPGLHLYGSPVPEGYTPLTVEVAPREGLVVGPAELPAARPFRIAGLDESFVVYDGTVRASLPLSILGNHGAVTLTARVRYQACSATQCYPPAEVALELPIEGLDLTRE